LGEPEGLAAAKQVGVVQQLATVAMDRRMSAPRSASSTPSRRVSP
jgi:hypothetical protein